MPQARKNRPTQRTTSLLFINKGVESGNLSRSGTSTEAFKIHSFVQNRRRRRESLSYYLPIGGSSDDQPECDEDYQDPRSAGGLYSMTDLDSVLQNFDQRRRTTLTPSSVQPINNALDPFHTAVVPVNSRTLQFLQYAFASFFRRTHLAEALPPRSCGREITLTFRHDDFIRERLRRCVEDTMIMDSTLAVGLTCAGWTTEQPRFDKPLDFFLGRAIRAVRTCLSSSAATPSLESDRQWLLLSTYSLSISTFWLALAQTRDFEDLRRALVQSQIVRYLDAAVLHMKAACTLIAEGGGTKGLHPYILSSLILGDKYLAIIRMWPPILLVDWDPGRSPPGVDIPATLNHESLADLGTKLIPLLQTKAQSTTPSLLDVVADIIDYLHSSRSIWNHAQPDHDTEEWLFLRAQSLFFRLISISDLSDLEECTRLATLVFLLSLAKYEGMAVSLKCLIPQLVDQITLLWNSQANRNSIRPVLFWMICVTGVASIASGNTKWDLYSDLQEQALRLRHALGLDADSSVNKYCIFLKKYLFLPDEQESDLRTFLRLTS